MHKNQSLEHLDSKGLALVKDVLFQDCVAWLCPVVLQSLRHCSVQDFNAPKL